MKKTLVILLASTALPVGVGIPAWSALHRVEHSSKSSQDAPVVRLASDDEDEDRNHGRSYRSNDDGHRDGEDNDDDDDDDDGSGGRASASPAPAGTVAPPANGLFSGGAMPKVKVN